MNTAVWGVASGVAAAVLSGASDGEVWTVQARFIAHGTPG